MAFIVVSIPLKSDNVIVCANHCTTCMLSNVCDRTTVFVTSDELDMMTKCLRRHGNTTAPCDDCSVRFTCYTSKVNKYSGDK